jgi:hypothetical protein
VEGFFFQSLLLRHVLNGLFNHFEGVTNRQEIGNVSRFFSSG